MPGHVAIHIEMSGTLAQNSDNVHVSRSSKAWAYINLLPPRVSLAMGMDLSVAEESVLKTNMILVDGCFYSQSNDQGWVQLPLEMFLFDFSSFTYPNRVQHRTDWEQKLKDLHCSSIMRLTGETWKGIDVTHYHVSGDNIFASVLHRTINAALIPGSVGFPIEDPESYVVNHPSVRATFELWVDAHNGFPYHVIFVGRESGEIAGLELVSTPLWEPLAIKAPM